MPTVEVIRPKRKVEKREFVYPFSHGDRNKWDSQRNIYFDALKYVTKWGTAIDGGAFVGSWSFEMLQNFETVVAFECIPGNARCFRQNTPEAILIEKALSSTDEPRLYFVKNKMWAHLSKGDREIECTYLDKYTFKDLGLIKLDVEGQEVAALEGAKRTIEEHRPVLVIEMKFDREGIAQALRQYGYKKAEGNKLDEIWISAGEGGGG